MRLRTALFISLFLGAATGVLTFLFFPPVPLAASPMPDLMDGPQLGHLTSAVIAAMAVYASLGALLIGSIMIAELAAVQDSLRSTVRPGRRGPLKSAEWDAAFKTTSLATLARRIVSRSVDADDDRLLLTSPFSPREARAELRHFYQRRLVVSQVWTFGIALLAVAAISTLPSAAAVATGHSLTLLSAASAALVFAAMAVSWLTTTGSMETLLGTICELPLLLESSARLRTAPVPVGPARDGASLPATDIALALRTEGETLVRRLAEVASRAMVTDPEVLMRLIDSASQASAAALDKRISGFLHSVEGLVAATQAVAEKLDGRLALLPEIWAQNYAAERNEMARILSDIAAAGHVEVKALRQALAEALEKQATELERIGQESREASVQIGETIASLGSGLEEARGASLAKATQLVQTVEAYTSRLLPAVKRLEACDERVVATVGRQDETLARLAVVVSELSGTLESMQTALAYGLGSTTAIQRLGDHVADLRTAAEGGGADLLTMSQQLRSILEEMEDAPGPG